MRTVSFADDDERLLRHAEEATGIRDEVRLIREALQQMVAREAARRLIELGGSDPDATAAPRRRLD